MEFDEFFFTCGLVFLIFKIYYYFFKIIILGHLLKHAICLRYLSNSMLK
jgi:hypothetical protein